MSDDTGTGSASAQNGPASTPPPQPALHHREQTAFGTYEVYADDDPHQLNAHRNNEIHQSEFNRLQHAWENIHHDEGMHIHGTAADRATWDRDLADGLQHSSAFRHAIEEIGNDAAHPIDVDLGQHQPGVFVDSFATNAVDLADLSQLPAHDPQAGHRNETTQVEIMDHFLQERHFAATHPDSDFDAAHQQALRHQNQVRDERGQDHVVAQVGDDTDGDGVWDSMAHFQYAHGQQEDIAVDDNYDITSITPPNDR